MMINLEMGPGFYSTVETLSSMGRAVLGAVSRGLHIGANLGATTVSRDYLSGQSLKTRSGRLKGAVDGWMEGQLDAVVGVRPNAAVDDYKYLLGDEEVTIVPKKAKFLAIPIGEGLTKAGVPRFASPREKPDGFFVSTKGRLLFGYKRGKKGKFRPLFTLVKSVFVQGTGALYDGVMDSIDGIGDAIETEIGKVTEG